MADRPSSSDRPRVLLIEDNLTQMDLYALVLRDTCEVLTASRGESGHALAVLERPDAIVVDVLLPDTDGLEVCERLLDNPATSTIPLIVLTGHDAAFARAKTMRRLHAVMKKPCPIDELLAVINGALAARQMR